MANDTLSRRDDSVPFDRELARTLAESLPESMRALLIAALDAPRPVVEAVTVLLRSPSFREASPLN